MGEPILDLSPDRLLRSMPKAMAVDVVQTMYGSDSARVDLNLRIQNLCLTGRPEGVIVYDVDPIVFDDLIEIRTGGDNSVTVLVERGGLVHASFWPLRSTDEDAVLSGWADALQATEDRPHVVLAEVNSRLEQALTFDFGYGAYARDAGRLRRLTSQRFVEELRDRERQVLAAQLQAVTATDRRYIAVDADLNWTGRLATLPAWPEIRTEPLTEAVPEWRFVTSWDGTRVQVNQLGVDVSGNNPTTPGYSAVASCNCVSCCDNRLAEAQDADYDDPVDDYYEEEDEG